MKTTYIKIRGKSVAVSIDGHGSLPCLFIGAAGLFRKPNLFPVELKKKLLTCYFVDTWERTPDGPIFSEPLSWQLLVNEIEEIRAQLKLDKLVLFAHSAAVPLGYEYGLAYPDQCLCLLLFNPWTPPLFDKSVKHFIAQAEPNRLDLIAKDEVTRKILHPRLDDEGRFLLRFLTRRGLFWKDFRRHDVLAIWEDYHPDVIREEEYSQQLLSHYDLINRPPLEVPVFWGLGQYDFSNIFSELTDGTNSFLKQPRSTCHIFDAGHYPFLENPEEVTASIKSFFETEILQHSSHAS